MESIPSSANVEFRLIVFRSRIPAKKFLVLKDADLLLQVQLEFEELSTGGRGLSDVGRRTKQKDEVITGRGSSYELFSQKKKRYNGG
jgi:hypothetical protein